MTEQQELKHKRGWLVNAGNNEISIKMALASVYTIKTFQDQKHPIAVFLDSADKWPSEYDWLVDYVIEYPFGDSSANMNQPQLNQWQLYHVTPFEQNILIEADTFILGDLDYVWKLGEAKSVLLPMQITDFRDEAYMSPHTMYFQENKIKTVHAGIWYFKAKDELAETYFKMLDVVSQNWRDAFKNYLKPEHVHEWPELDTLHSITMKMVDEYDNFLVSDPRFLRYTHMISTADTKWNDVMNTWFTNGFKIDNYRQRGVCKYTEPTVMTDVIFDGIRNNYRSANRKD